MKQTYTKIMMLFMLIAAAALSAVRFFQYMSLMDLSTGYFITGAEVGGILIYVLLAVFAVGFVALSVIAKKGGNTAFSVSSDGMGDNATRALGFSEIIAAGLVLVPLFETSFTIQSAGMIVAGIVMAVAGFVLLGRIVPPAFIGFLQFICAVYMMIRSLACFSGDLTVLNHSDNLIALMGCVLSAAMYASIARFYLRYENPASRTREIISAGLTFIAASAHVFPKVIAYIAGGSTTAGMSGINYDVAAALAVSATFLVVVFCTKKKKDIFLLEDEEESEKRKKAAKTAAR